MPAKRTKRGQRGLFNKRLTPDEQEVQREAAFAAIKRLYCAVVPVWRTCRRGYCRRHRCCIGSPGPCLKRAWPLLPKPIQDRAQKEVQAGGPHRIAAATHTEWLLRRFPPSNFTH